MRERLKQLRKQLDMTQQEFADRIGIKRNSFAYLMKYYKEYMKLLNTLTKI